jgi:hypothetical protein
MTQHFTRIEIENLLKAFSADVFDGQPTHVQWNYDAEGWVDSAIVRVYNTQTINKPKEQDA